MRVQGLTSIWDACPLARGQSISHLTSGQCGLLQSGLCETPSRALESRSPLKRFFWLDAPKATLKQSSRSPDAESSWVESID